MYEIQPPHEGMLEAPFRTSEELEATFRGYGIWSERLELAFQQALTSHQFKTRDSGQPYLDEHIFPVALDVVDYLRQKGESLRVQELAATVSLLHDTVEDDPDFDFPQCEQLFGSDVSKLVYPLTKIGVNKDIYIQKLINAPELDQIIKLCDRVNNLKCSIVLAQKPRPQARHIDKLKDYTEETQQFYLHIADLLLDKDLYWQLQNLVTQSHALLRSESEVA